MGEQKRRARRQHEGVQGQGGSQGLSREETLPRWSRLRRAQGNRQPLRRDMTHMTGFCISTVTHARVTSIIDGRGRCVMSGLEPHIFPSWSTVRGSVGAATGRFRQAFMRTAYQIPRLSRVLEQLIVFRIYRPSRQAYEPSGQPIHSIGENSPGGYGVGRKQAVLDEFYRPSPHPSPLRNP